MRVAVAADFYKPLETIANAFSRQSGIQVVISAGSSGGLYAQIANGAPYDVFLSANARYPRQLVAAGLAAGPSRFTYAQGVLVLWGAQPAPAAGPETLRGTTFAHLALANPHFAPYGQAAQEVLMRLGLLEQLHSRLVFGEDVGQALQFAISGGAQYAFVSSAQLLAAGLWQRGSHWVVPVSLYTPINQQAVLLVHARDVRAARSFLRFLRGPARPLIARLGYRLPAETGERSPSVP
ncbi:MAG: molybdate ABC transporter substrate-binding protein [Gammaproteobacteria bacterium]